MKDLLIVTMLDYRQFANNRVHHIIDQFSKNCEKITVLYKKAYFPRQSPSLNQMKSFFFLSDSIFTMDNVKCIEVDTIFNKPDGIGLHVLNLESPHTKTSRIKSFCKKLFSNLGMLTELFYAPSFLLIFFIRVGRTMDVFIGQGPWEMLFGFLLKKLGYVKILVYDDFDYAVGYYHTHIRKGLIGRVENFMIKRSDLVVSVGKRLSDLRKKETGIQGLVIPNGVDYELFSKGQIKEDHVPTIVYMGFVSDWSGVDLIIKAIQKVKVMIPDIKFLVIGHTTYDYINHVKSLVNHLGLENHFEYVGAKSYADLPQYLKRSDIGMAVFRPIELRKFAFSLKVIEYFAGGLPVITVNDTQSADVVSLHRGGRITDYSPDLVASAIEELLCDSALYRILAENAQTAAKEYSWENLMNGYFRAIKEVFYKADWKEQDEKGC